jgi:hypothetical protein
MVGEPICSHCYEELRELLIERSAEVETVIAQGRAEQEQAVIAQALSNRAANANRMVG